MGAKTVKDLYNACKEMIKQGYSNKVILLSGDDEGNDFHTLYYLFTADKETIEAYAQMECFCDGNNPEDVVILG